MHKYCFHFLFPLISAVATVEQFFQVGSGSELILHFVENIIVYSLCNIFSHHYNQDRISTLISIPIINMINLVVVDNINATSAPKFMPWSVRQSALNPQQKMELIDLNLTLHHFL
ncbi:hypothetical protein ACJX0J_017623, partial [Zea mays]